MIIQCNRKYLLSWPKWDKPINIFFPLWLSSPSIMSSMCWRKMGGSLLIVWVGAKMAGLFFNALLSWGTRRSLFRLLLVCMSRAGIRLRFWWSCLWSVIRIVKNLLPLLSILLCLWSSSIVLPKHNPYSTISPKESKTHKHSTNLAITLTSANSSSSTYNS